MEKSEGSSSRLTTLSGRDDFPGMLSHNAFAFFCLFLLVRQNTT
jgi:hypothetical protein